MAKKLGLTGSLIIFKQIKLLNWVRGLCEKDIGAKVLLSKSGKSLASSSCSRWSLLQNTHGTTHRN